MTSHNNSLRPRNISFRSHPADDAGGLRSKLAYTLIIGLTRTLLATQARVQLTGTHHLPATGAVIFASTHLCYADPLAMGPGLTRAGRRPRYLAKAEAFTVPILGPLIRTAGTIRVERGTAAAQESLEPALAFLAANGSIALYPEGTTTAHADFWPENFRTGTARMALLSGAPIVPLAQWGSQQVMGHSVRATMRRLLRPHRRVHIHLHVGAPLTTANLLRSAAPADPAGPEQDEVVRITAALSQHMITMLSVLRGEQPPAWAGKRCLSRDQQDCPCGRAAQRRRTAR